MYKLSLLMLFIILFQSCAETGYYDVDFSKNHTFFKMKPTRYITTWNWLEIEGFIDCKVNILIPGGNSILFEPGKIKYAKRHEWFDEGKIIQIINEGCSNKSHLRIYYSYNASYW